MDNDCVIKKKLIQTYRAVRLKIDYAGMGLISDQEGNEYIADLLKKDDPFMVGRFGAVEMHCVSNWMRGKNCTEAEKDQALFAAGIFPNDDITIERFCNVYTDAMKYCDLLGVWEVIGEKRAILRFCEKPILLPSRAIEPYYFGEPWSAQLANKKVLIVHPFIKSIQNQLDSREKIWPGKNILPEFKAVQFIKSVQSNAGGQTDFSDWVEALEYMKEQIIDCDFDVAIIGAGAYGFPLAAYVKKLNKQAIQMSGATQILFGIKGKRWDNHPIISGFYNSAWVRPLQNEKPPKFRRVEGGSYW